MTAGQIRTIRESLGLTQVAMAKRLGVHSNTVARWERGEVEVPEPVARFALEIARKGRQGAVGRRGEHERLARQLADLIDYPREDLSCEYKSWMDLSSDADRANVAKALLALANHGGGFLVFGFREEHGVLQPDPVRPERLRYSQDDVNNIVKRYADPSFHCQVELVASTATGEEFPVVRVPGGHGVPIRARRSGPGGNVLTENTYYVRRPGPESAPARETEEWRALIRQCLQNERRRQHESIREILEGPSAPSKTDAQNAEEAVDAWARSGRARFNELIEQKLSEERPSRYAHGIYTVAYVLGGHLETPRLADFRAILHRVKGNETGWPPWWVPTRAEIAPYPRAGMIECWMRDSHTGGPDHSDFWLAEPSGKMFLVRGYQEDGSDRRGGNPGEIFSMTLPVWRITECLLHAERLAAGLGDPSATVGMQVRWEGLSDRVLSVWPSRDSFIAPDDGVVARDGTAETLGTFEADRVTSDLEEILTELLRPLFETFGYFEPPDGLVGAELARFFERTKARNSGR